jgi:hypothetical protein
MVEAELQDLAGTDDQQAMIRAMVDGLEERLKSDGDDLEGWQRLIRSRAVLKELDKAKAAYATARHHFMDRPEALAALDGLATELNIMTRKQKRLSVIIAGPLLASRWGWPYALSVRSVLLYAERNYREGRMSGREFALAVWWSRQHQKGKGPA